MLIPELFYQVDCMTFTVECPTCSKAIVWCEAEEFRPFCSERCRLIDLGEWATGSYSIPGPPGDDKETEPKETDD